MGPAWQAAVSEQVPAQALPAAIAINGISYNIARSVGPAGIIVATAGTFAAFALNAVSYVPLIGALYLWKRAAERSRLPPGRLDRAILLGVRYSPTHPDHGRADPDDYRGLNQRRSMQDLRLVRKRNRAFGWSLARNMADPDMWIERYHFHTWHDYLRHRNRSTQTERALEARVIKSIMRVQARCVYAARSSCPSGTPRLQNRSVAWTTRDVSQRSPVLIGTASEGRK